MKSSSGFLTGSDLSTTASKRLKIAVVAPMPSASVSTATIVKAGAFSSPRMEYRKSFISKNEYEKGIETHS